MEEKKYEQEMIDLLAISECLFYKNNLSAAFKVISLASDIFGIDTVERYYDATKIDGVS